MNRAVQKSRVWRTKALKRVGLHSAAGVLPAGLWLLGCGLYFLITAPIERFSSLRVPFDLTLMFRITEGIGAVGAVIGALIGFVRSRNDFGFVQRYLFLFAFGGLVPVLASLVQYSWYRSEPSQFAFADTALTAVGRPYTESSRTRIGEELRHTEALTASVRAIQSAIPRTQYVSYIDPVDYWETQDKCRRLGLGDMSDAMCVQREKIVSPQSGISLSYWPILRELPLSANATEFRVDYFFLTGQFRCPVPNDLTGGGGFNFLRHEQVDGEKLRTCMTATERALDARVGQLSGQVGVLGQHVFMPYWYFLCSAIFAFVGSDFALVEPVGFWPVIVGVCIAVFRYLYFAVLVVVLLEPISLRRE